MLALLLKTLILLENDIVGLLFKYDLKSLFLKNYKIWKRDKNKIKRTWMHGPEYL